MGGGAASTPTSATRTRCGRRCAGSTPCATRPRWWATASTPRDAPAYAAHNDLGTAVLLAAMYEAGVFRLVLAGSMVVYGEGRYDLRRARRRPAGARAPPTPSPPGGSNRPARSAAATSCPASSPEDAPLDPRSTYAATKLAQEHLASAWARQTGGAVWSLRYHNVYGAADAARHPLLRGGVGVPVGAGARRSRRG